jgi:hypothetical protein
MLRRHQEKMPNTQSRNMACRDRYFIKLSRSYFTAALENMHIPVAIYFTAVVIKGSPNALGIVIACYLSCRTASPNCASWISGNHVATYARRNERI